MSALICLLAHKEMGLPAAKVVRVVDAYIGAFLSLCDPCSLTWIHRPPHALATVYIRSLHSEVLQGRSFAKEISSKSYFAQVASFVY